MTPHDSGMFAAVLAELGEVFSEQVSHARARLYFEALSGLTLGQVREAARRIIATSREPQRRSTPSARARAASFADSVTAPRIRSSIVAPSPV